MRATFLDPVLDATFDRLGYVTVPFLDADEVDQVSEVYWRLGPAPGDPRISIHFDFQSTSREYKEAVRSELRQLLRPKIDRLLDRYHLFSPAFIMKWPDARSGFAPHQDASIVDEDRFHSLSVWCPLVDTMDVRGRDNGMIRFVPGSHRFVPWIRAQNPGAFAFEGCEAAITHRHGVALPLRAGHAVVFDHRTVHFSMPNSTADPRLVVVMGLRPAEAPLLHFRRDEEAFDGTIEHFDVYEIDDDYFTRLDPFSVRAGVPGYEQIDRVTAERPVISPERLDEMCTSGASHRPGRLRDRLRRRSRVNARPFCFRCGTEEGLLGDISQVEHGNVQFLCASCSAEEVGSATR